MENHTIYKEREKERGKKEQQPEEKKKKEGEGERTLDYINCTKYTQAQY